MGNKIWTQFFETYELSIYEIFDKRVYSWQKFMKALIIVGFYLKTTTSDRQTLIIIIWFCWKDVCTWFSNNAICIQNQHFCLHLICRIQGLTFIDTNFQCRMLWLNVVFASFKILVEVCKKTLKIEIFKQIWCIQVQIWFYIYEHGQKANLLLNPKLVW